MSVILKPSSGVDVQINMWHWRPTMLLVQQILDLEEQRFELLQVNGVGASISSAEAEKIADYLEGYLANFPEHGRLLLNGFSRVSRREVSRVRRTGSRITPQVMTG